MTPEPPGYALLKERVQRTPEALREFLKQPAPAGWLPPPHARFIATGAGSSEAHARYLVSLLNEYTSHPAEFQPLSFFSREVPVQDRVLVVFSQGLSPNATLALRHASRFSHLICFTSSTLEGLHRNGKADRAALLESLVRKGASILPFPLEEEYTTLIRFVGPMVGYAAAARFAHSLPGSRSPAIGDDVVRAVEQSLEPRDINLLPKDRRQLVRAHLVAGHPVIGYAQNLVYKFQEGLFLPAPPLSDLFQYAHGPFQQNAREPGPVFFFSSDEDPFRDALEAMNQAAGIPTHFISSSLPPALRILEYEAILNVWLLQLIGQWNIDQVNWPAKGLDGPLYDAGSERTQNP